ncbi:MAG TPA: hypothetical protein VNH18_23990 [Bryobacteraceae bacterium]|nr:hypothetical protein [Bryobacteraceae bacterium]
MAETTNKHPEPEPDNSSHVSHERSDIDIFQITGYGVGLAISCIVVVFAMWAMFDFLGKREDKLNPANPPAMVKERQMLPPAPRLQSADSLRNPHVEMKELRDTEDAILGSYGIVDAAKGTVRVPIAVAIDMTAQKGLPSKPSAAGSSNQGYRMIPSDASSGRTLEKISQ